MHSALSRLKKIRAGLLGLAASAALGWTPLAHAALCSDRLWSDAMIGSHHFHPDKDFE